MSPNAPRELELQQPPQAPSPTHSSHRAGVKSQSYHSRDQSKSSPVAEDEPHHFDDVDITGLQPPPSALTPTSATAYDPQAPSPLDDFPRPGRSSHQRSLTGTIFDNFNRATSTIQQHTSRASSPTKSLASFIPSRGQVESNASQPKIRAIQNWFSGSSSVKLGASPRQDYSDSESGSGEEYDSESEEEEEEEEEERGNMMANIFNRGPSLTRGASESPRRSDDTQTQTQTQTQTKAPSQPTAGSKFAWLLSTQKNAAVPPPQQSPTYHNPDDELINLKISQALFPHGPADPLAPSSFHDLLTNAEALLSRYQSAYRQLSTALVDAHSEQSAQEDELDEAETRARHLKMQLQTMAARAADQDEQMRSLMEDLAFERKARQEEEAARKRSLALIRQCEHTTCQETTRRHNRISGSEISVDSGFESEAETDAASVFSRNCLSPTDTDRSSVLDSEARDTTPKGRKTQPLQRGSNSTITKPRQSKVEIRTWGCENCEGGAQSAVWGRLAKEREENRTLRLRVETLEEAVDGALNAVTGGWGM
ncbi:chromosome segregation SMC common bacterial type [Pyrenophora seminiperda CCB06]|uniref:Chromosome segregation SMC common bacterial type n=1 Tax=Pyrenophora seminiperda CCB06 TaxID=1302712 RepID=A0A3M7M948_9PLEO|nr:chromosome segregation SMC common bacterial type [Pyrenophora seminiperda CCB06]